MLGLVGSHFARAENVAQIGQCCIGSQPRIKRAFPGVDHVLGCDLSSIMEAGILAQMEGVNPAVQVDIPGCCQVGCQVQIRIEGDQSAIDQFTPEPCVVAGSYSRGLVLSPPDSTRACCSDP